MMAACRGSNAAEAMICRGLSHSATAHRLDSRCRPEECYAREKSIWSHECRWQKGYSGISSSQNMNYAEICADTLQA